MKHVIWKNQDLAEPICFDQNRNVIGQYEEGCEGKGEVYIYENGYGYFRFYDEQYPQEGYCLENQDFSEYVDEKHQPQE